MKSLLLLLTLLLLLITSSLSLSSSSSSSSSPLPHVCQPQDVHAVPSADTLSHYTLSVQWPYTTCFHLSGPSPPPSNKNCQVPPATFTVFSFWPSTLTLQAPQQSPPVCCVQSDERHFHTASILDLKPALRRFWPDLRGAADEALWRYNWIRYGSCSHLRERSYFRRVLQLERQFDPVHILKAFGIAVSTDRRYAVARVQHAANNIVGGFTVRLVCVVDPATHHLHTPFLHYIQICLHPVSFNVIDCPPVRGNSTEWKEHVITNADQPCLSFSHLIIPYGPSAHRNNTPDSNSNTPYRNQSQSQPNHNSSNSNSDSNHPKGDAHNNHKNASESGSGNGNGSRNNDGSNQPGKSNDDDDDDDDNNDEMTFLDAALYIMTSLAIFITIAFCIFYQFQAVQSPHLDDLDGSQRPSRTYYHPIHTAANTNS